MISGQPELERFAKALMTSVRDSAINSCDRFASGSPKGQFGDIWRKAMESESVGGALVELIPEIVDLVLFELLDAIDSEDLPLAWTAEDGELIPLEVLGSSEMAGWLIASPGWRHEYSRTRFSDPLAV